MRANLLFSGQEMTSGFNGEVFFHFYIVFPALLVTDNCKVCTPAHITGEEENGAHISQKIFCRSNWNVPHKSTSWKTCPSVTE